jgi:dephospho-CoA kinase
VIVAGRGVGVQSIMHKGSSMLLIGLVGGIASGKSTVAECFRALGAAVLDADQAGHEVLRDPAVISAIKQRWGEKILDAEGQVSRGAVARVVFAPGGEREKEFLEQLTHPRIQMRIQQRIQQLQSSGTAPPPVVVLDAALLFEAGWNRICDKIVFVDTADERRREWAAARGWTAEQLAERERAQLPVELKRSRADIVIHNAGSRDELQIEARRVWDELTAVG